MNNPNYKDDQDSLFETFIIETGKDPNTATDKEFKQWEYDRINDKKAKDQEYQNKMKLNDKVSSYTNFTPNVEYLSSNELEQRNKEQDKNAQNKGSGIGMFLSSAGDNFATGGTLGEINKTLASATNPEKRQNIEEKEERYKTARTLGTLTGTALGMIFNPLSVVSKFSKGLNFGIKGLDKADNVARVISDGKKVSNSTKNITQTANNFKKAITKDAGYFAGNEALNVADQEFQGHEISAQDIMNDAVFSSLMSLGIHGAGAGFNKFSKSKVDERLKQTSGLNDDDMSKIYGARKRSEKFNYDQRLTNSLEHLANEKDINGALDNFTNSHDNFIKSFYDEFDKGGDLTYKDIDELFGSTFGKNENEKDVKGFMGQIKRAYFGDIYKSGENKPNLKDTKNNKNTNNSKTEINTNSDLNTIFSLKDANQILTDLENDINIYSKPMIQKSFNQFKENYKFLLNSKVSNYSNKNKESIENIMKKTNPNSIINIDDIAKDGLSGLRFGTVINEKIKNSWKDSTKNLRFGTVNSTYDIPFLIAHYSLQNQNFMKQLNKMGESDPANINGILNLIGRTEGDDTGLQDSLNEYYKELEDITNQISSKDFEKEGISNYLYDFATKNNLNVDKETIDGFTDFYRQNAPNDYDKLVKSLSTTYLKDTKEKESHKQKTIENYNLLSSILSLTNEYEDTSKSNLMTNFFNKIPLNMFKDEGLSELDTSIAETIDKLNKNTKIFEDRKNMSMSKIRREMQNAKGKMTIAEGDRYMNNNAKELYMKIMGRI